MKLKPFLQGFGIFAVVLTLIPLIAADFWWIRMFDYPHIELTLLTLTALFAYFLRFKIDEWSEYAFVTVLTACLIYQFVKIMPYTPIVPKEIGDVSENVKKDSEFKIITSNVLQKNEISDSLISQIHQLKPDIAVFTETDERWSAKIKEGIGKDYPYKVEAPLPNTYGMLLYSKFKLENAEVRYLVDDSIPSIHAIVTLNSGEKINFFAIHPTPPMPQENPSSSDRDAEMMKIGLETSDSKLPVLVIGDFNDVPWSQTVGLFKSVGELLDVRIGRSFHNTFNAGSFILRWPLDHIFLSEEFRVRKIAAGPDIHSDHFHFYAELALQPELAEEQIPDPATQEQIEKAKEQIKKEEKENAEKGQNH